MMPSTVPQDEVIRTALANCTFRRILAGAPVAGVHYLGCAEPPNALMQGLRARNPWAVAVDDAGLEAERQ